jgi:hypothetical protein
MVKRGTGRAVWPMSMRDRDRHTTWSEVACAALVGACAVSWACDASAEGLAPRVRVRGSAHIELHVARDAGMVFLSGAVVDDAARPVVDARVALTLARALDPLHPLGIAAARPEPCEAGGLEPDTLGDDGVRLTTDEEARFCVAFVLATDRYTAHVTSPRSALVDGAAADLTFDLAVSPVTLRFVPERSTLSLDDEMVAISVIASTDPDDQADHAGRPEPPGPTTAAAGILLVLSNESGARLDTATTDPSGVARFGVAGPRLGPAGPGELRVAFAGDTRRGPAGVSARVERRARVEIAAPDATSGRLPAAWPEDGIPVRVTAALACARRGCLGSPEGVIEASLAADGIVGAAPVDDGAARLVISFAAPSSDGASSPGSSPGAGVVGRPVAADARSTLVPIRVRYIPGAPCFQPGADLLLAQPVRGPSLWKRAPLVLAAGAVVAWLVLARYPVRSRWRAPRPAIAGAGRPIPEAHVALVRPVSTATGWCGTVSDAHDGVAIAQARVHIERRDFEHIRVVASTTSAADGRFELGHVDTRTGDEIVVDAPRHAMVRRPLPPAGELSVALVLRRRAVLDRLVGWARRQGPPYGPATDPTPGQVRRAAGADGAVARWAAAVEQAAYGAAVVDEHAEADVDRLAPASAGDVRRANPTRTR